MSNGMVAEIKSVKYEGSVCRRCNKPLVRGQLFAHAGRGIGFHVECCPYPTSNPEVTPLAPVVRLGERMGNALVEVVRRYGQNPEVWQALKTGIGQALEKHGMKVGW